jgi:hypothetical protein
MRFKDNVAVALALLALLLTCGFGPKPAENLGADIIVTSAPVYEPLAALRGEERFPKGAQLLLLHDGVAHPLLPKFAASADANVSFDGNRVLFAGKQKAGDPWQVWELTLADHSVRKLIDGASDVIRPFYLPFGRLVYARRTAQGFQLEAAGKDTPEALDPIDANAGSTVLPLSHLPASVIPADVLQDGRILFESSFPLGAGSSPELYLVYSDGSGVESYRCDHNAAGPNGRWGGHQLASGDVVFTHGSALARFTSPLAQEAPIVAPQAEYAGALAETSAGAWLLSARADAGSHYALKLWNPGDAALQALLENNAEDIVEPVLVAPRARPKRHPSALHNWSYANLLALDARESRDGNLKAAPTTVQLETLDDAGNTIVTGRARVESDGSFFVKAPSDKPIRFALLDQNGAVLRQEHGWFWIRSGEQRICVGCHAGPEHAAINRVPAVLLRSIIPVDLSAVHPLASTQSLVPGNN